MPELPWRLAPHLPQERLIPERKARVDGRADGARRDEPRIGADEPAHSDEDVGQPRGHDRALRTDRRGRAKDAEGTRAKG
jgi:hypothetical protein